MASAIVVAPPEQGLPEANVPAVMIDETVTDCSMTWNTLARGALVVMARNIDGVSAAAGAHVRVESELGVVLNAGTFAVAGAQSVTLPATGTVRLDALADDSGRAMFPVLPLSTYKITVVPRRARPTPR